MTDSSNPFRHDAQVRATLTRMYASRYLNVPRSMRWLIGIQDNLNNVSSRAVGNVKVCLRIFHNQPLHVYA